MAMEDIKYWTVTEPYLRIKCGLGEAPFYEEASNSLRFVDIVNRKFYSIDLGRGPSSLQQFDLEVAVGTTADLKTAKDDKIIVGAKHGYATMNRKTGEIEYVKRIWNERDGLGKEERMRFNDGAVDKRGRYWAGAMNDPLVVSPTDEGVVFRLDTDMTLNRMLEKVTIPNGIGWSGDDKTMYFTDSPTRTIWSFDYDLDTGNISNRRAHFVLEEEPEDAVPDGWAMDVEGCIWTAVFGAGKILRLSPEGKIIGEVSLPTRCVTCPGFVGEELYITSAAEEDPQTYPDSVKYAGCLFQVHVGVRGMPIHAFGR